MIRSYKRKNMECNRIILGVVLFLFLCSILFFDYLGFERMYVDMLTKVCAVCLFFYVMFFPWTNRRMHFQYLVLGLVLVPMLSFIPCYSENGQTFIDSFKAYSFFFLFFVYYLCHDGKITETDLVKWITILAIIRTLILIIQQFTYPNYWFALRPDGFDQHTGLFRHEIEIRSGIYRFYIEDTFLSMFLVFYYVDKLTKTIKMKYVVLVLYGLLGIYLDQSRQFMASTIGALFFVLISNSRMKNKYSLLSFVTIVLIIIYFNFNILFGNLINLTDEDLSMDYIRVASYNHYLYDAWGGPFSFIFGNGPVGGSSAYGKVSLYYEQEMRYFHSDVGIVGALHLFGVVTVLYLFFAYYTILRRWKQLDDHIKMFFIGTLFNIPLVCIYTQRPGYYVFWSFMLYLADLSIIRKHDNIINNEKIKNKFVENGLHLYSK